MPMKALNDLRIFVEAAKLGSFSQVARNMELTAAAVSASVKRLEQELGVSLFARSTRKIRLTSDGELFLEHCQQALDLIDDGKAAVQTQLQGLSGVLKLSAPSDLGRNILLPWLDEFMALHPKVELRLHLSDSYADIYSKPIDVALRYGELKDASLVAVPVLSDNYRVLCAAPSYLAAKGEPQTPDELTQHDCLCFSFSDTPQTQWNFQQQSKQQNKPLKVMVLGRRMANDGDIVSRWLLNGEGIAYRSYLDVVRYLRSGELVQLCPTWVGEPAPLYMVCANRRMMTPLVKELRTFLQAKLAVLLA
ncbi:LysR family transcriptional regulator [Corallincola luteus]|uniref:LysR family transcriptional regulator n=2 Tax=Corallincola TaxID=1775176 RepID=A0ABY1WLU1_9GAMM|nr:LysR family transcriptional regulator [Corallincola spongiicola]TCI02284.1 LysR family transcriptional regulator [Corallincola luteus]